MQIFGLGLTELHWKLIFQNIQKPLSHLKIKARLLSQSEIQPESIITTCETISKSPPALFLLTPQGFQAFTDCLFFLSQLQTRIPHDETNYGLIIESIEKDLNPFIAYNPEVILTNKMRISVSDPSLFTQKTIQRFPRIQINDPIIRIEYLGLNNRVINQSLDEIPLNRLISLNQIKKVYSKQRQLSSESWLAEVVNQHGKTVDLSQIKGILKEKQGMYLFPGIPLDRVETMILGDIQVHFLLFYERLNQRSLSFKRMITQLKVGKTHTTVLQKESKPIRCLGASQIINQFTEIFLSNMGVDNLRFIEDLSPGTHALEESILWVQLVEFEAVTLQGNYLNWNEPIKKILQALNFFIEVNTLTISSTFSKEPLSRIEFEGQRNQLMKQEKQLQGEHRLAKNKYLLYTQEENVLKEATHLSQRLIQYLANGFLFDEVIAKKYKIDATQVLFFCEEQEQAYELNQLLTHVPKKLWINPQDYQTPDQLNQLNIETIQQYAENGIIVITSESTEHWESLNNHVFERFHSLSNDTVLQKQIIEQSQIEQDYLQHQKQELALRWIHSSLEQLFLTHKSTLLQEAHSL